jgi:hypothetical protein
LPRAPNRRPLLVLVVLLLLLAIGYVARTVRSDEHGSTSAHSQTVGTVALSGAADSMPAARSR